MNFSSVTVRYRPLNDKETNPSSKIYDLYIQGLVRLLKIFSYCLLFYCMSILIFRCVEVYITGFQNDTDIQVLWATSVIMHGFGVVTGIVGLRSVFLKSRGSSRNFFIVMILLDILYISVQGYFMYILSDSEKITTSTTYDISFSNGIAVYFFVITAFSLIFITVKSYRFHMLLSKLIEKNKANNFHTIGELSVIPEIN
ncbi:hypothetical protein SteCoe_6249 [Stentor coeruleus]|uniref:Uncharacterized protein n=1 Tax=Stentor coeruleus TaxID=5963 RepID=A0A1R2CQI9_9CILI|nr:hypothetical protein SteCoe_6249 [Stentor coeruleus]